MYTIVSIYDIVMIDGFARRYYIYMYMYTYMYM